MCSMTMQFDSYKKRANQIMKQHMRIISNMIPELKSAGDTLTDEQHV